MVNLLVKILVGLVILAFILWGVSKSLIREKSPAEKYVHHYFKLVETKDYGVLVSYYCEDFFRSNNVSRTEFLDRVRERYQRLGELHEYKLTQWQQQEPLKENPEYMYYRFEIASDYANDGAQESIVLRKGRNASKFEVVRHTVAPYKIRLEG